MPDFVRRFRIKECDISLFEDSGLGVLDPPVMQDLEQIRRVITHVNYAGTVKSLRNSGQLDFDIDDSLLDSLINDGWERIPWHRLSDLPNIQPDGIIQRGGRRYIVEVEKANKKTIWFDYIKQMMLIGRDVGDFGLLIVPTNYCHKRGEWPLYSEAISYRDSLYRYAQVSGITIQKLFIVGYTQECDLHNDGNWRRFTQDMRNEIRSMAEVHFGA